MAGSEASRGWAPAALKRPSTDSGLSFRLATTSGRIAVARSLATGSWLVAMPRASRRWNQSALSRPRLRRSARNDIIARWTVLPVARFAVAVKCCPNDGRALSSRPSLRTTLVQPALAALGHPRRDDHLFDRRDDPRQQSTRTRARPRDAGDRPAPLRRRERASRATRARGVRASRTA